MATGGSVPAGAEEILVSRRGEHPDQTQHVEMLVRTSKVVRIDGRIPRFQVDDEHLITATPISENQIRLFAKSAGVTQIELWDTDRHHYPIRISILADTDPLENSLNRQMPLANLRLVPAGDAIILAGTVADPADVNLAMAIVQKSYPDVINHIQVVGVPQVLLHTRIMEVSRTKLRDAGVDWSLGGKHGTLTTLPCDAADGGPRSGLVGGDFPTLLAALRRDKLVKLLAEPTVIATHGKSAHFRVGGKVPSLVSGHGAATTISYEDYGTSIEFLPRVIAPGRLRLAVRPEVSEPDPDRAIHSRGVSATAFTSRQVETEVEMQTGQTLLLAGLIQCRSEWTVRQVPILGGIPYVGGIFRKAQNQQNEIELLITITPELIEPDGFFTGPPHTVVPSDFGDSAEELLFEPVPSPRGSPAYERTPLGPARPSQPDTESFSERLLSIP